MYSKLGLIVLLTLLLSTMVAAERGHTTLLATSDPLDGGVVADLYLEIKPGTGRVFIESSPLTRVDTQISTRFAKEVACNYVDRDCSQLDFFYTINARASIIGGPSAGAAMAALTVAELEGVELNESTAITGTINSGAIIGSVGGIRDKVEAASKSGITKVLIPKGERASFAFNQSVDLVEYGEELGVEVVEVFSMDEVMVEFTGQTFRGFQPNLEIDSRYTTVMQDLAAGLCERTDELESFSRDTSQNDTLTAVLDTAQNLSGQGVIANNVNNHYAAASFCFGANVRYKYLDLLIENPSVEDIERGLIQVESDTADFRKQLDNATTISDAQILAVVLDRITETQLHVDNSRDALNNSDRPTALFEYAFAIERLESAHSWSSFFGVMAESSLDPSTIRNACSAKVAEAEERVQYTSILLRREDSTARDRLEEAQDFQSRQNYVQCLHKASLAKAEANVLLSLAGTRAGDVPEIVDRKREAARISIARQSENDIFPVVGYSYYEYAGSLRDTDRFSALLFSEYALEFSNLELYFSEQPSVVEVIEPPKIDTITSTYYFVAGFTLGLLLAVVSVKIQKRPKKKRIIVKKKRSRR